MIPLNYIPNKKAGEEVVFHLRRHWFVFLTTFLYYIFLFLIPLAIYIFISYSLPWVFDDQRYYSVLIVLLFSYLLFIIVFAFTAWTEIYLDVWTVTTERIISREQNALFNRTVSELDLNRIQDVTVEQKGFFPTMLHYGDVYIQSAGETERFVFEQIPDPYHVAKTIQRINEKVRAATHPHNGV